MSEDKEIPAALKPVHIFRERERTAFIVRREEAEAAGLPYQFASRLITLTVHSSLEAVGFLAAITGRLAEAGISVNAVSAFYHDHLFVPESTELRKLCIICKMCRSKRSCRSPDEQSDIRDSSWSLSPAYRCADAGDMPRDYRNADTTISPTMPIIRLYFSA